MASGYTQTPVTALQRAMVYGGYPSLVSSRRLKRFQGRPGEIIEKMPEEVRALLRELRSEDISEEKLDRYAAWLGYEDDTAWIREAVEKFDREVLRVPEPIRWQRRRRSMPWS